MHKEVFSVSISIIGYNTKKELNNLLCSIQRLQLKNYMQVEVVYVDDGSTDGSYEFFKTFKLKFKKICAKLSCNAGRVEATEKSFSLANHDWILSVRSNIVLNENILVQYALCVVDSPALAYMGKILYTSKDKQFEWYLNHKKRGINSIITNQHIHYKYLLFGNSLLNNHAVKKISLNKKLLKYGGEELDFANKLNTKYPNSIRACPLAVATRVSHPNLRMHCKRLYCFGKYNLKFLTKKNQCVVLGGLTYLAQMVRFFILYSLYSFLIQKEIPMKFIQSKKILMNFLIWEK